MEDPTRKNLEKICAKFDISVELVESVVDMYLECVWHDIPSKDEPDPTIRKKKGFIRTETRNGSEGWAYFDDILPKRYVK